MTLGLLLRGLNNLKDFKVVDFLFEFIPMLTLLLSAFGYMVMLIVLKWTTDWTGMTHLSPSIINQMINIPLKKGAISQHHLLSDASL